MLAAALGLAALTGARRGELRALKWSDVDLTVGKIRIARSISSLGNQLLEGPTKTHAIRDVAIDEFALDLLMERRDDMRDIADQAQVDSVKDPYVLSRALDGATFLDPNSLTSSFSRLCRAMEAQALERARTQGRRKLRKDELRPFRFHDLRHFSVTLFIAPGIDVRTVAERHGHAQVTMTLNRYAHALPERDREAASLLGKALTG